MVRLAVVGPGRAGLALARRLDDGGWPVVAVRGRRPPAADLRAHLPSAVWDTFTDPLPWPPLDIVLVAVPDRCLDEVAAALAADDRCGRTVLHVSGLHPAEVLAPCRGRGAAVGSWHPLLAFPPPGAPPPPTSGVYCAVEGDEAAVETAEAAGRLLGMRPWRIAPGDKDRYHAAAAVAGNLAHILVAAARRELERCGLDRAEAAAALRPLVGSAVDAAFAARWLELLTGALVRGDTATVDRHLAVLPPPLAAAYEALSRLVARA